MSGRTGSEPPVVVLVDSYPKRLLGAQRRLLEWLDRWDRARATPVVVAPAEGDLPAAVRDRGVRLVLAPYPKALDLYGGGLLAGGPARKAARGLAAARYAWGLRGLLKREGAAAVHCDDMRGVLTAGVAAKSLGLPLSRWSNLESPLGLLDKLELPLCDRVLLISDAMRDKYPPAQVKKYGHKLRTIYGGIDLSAVDAAGPDRARFGVPEDAFVVAHAGSLNRRKGLDRLLAAWPRVVDAVPHARLLSAGGPGELAEDRAFAGSLPNRDLPSVTRLGHREDVPTLMHSADVCVLPSRHEGMGRVLVEAMAAGKPCVGSPAGGIPEVILHERTGLIVDDPDDPAALADALVRLARDPDLRTRFGEAGRHRARTAFDGATCTDALLDELYALPGRSRGRRVGR